ncbi:MAG: aminotransferase class I/II-fold pyridoxal phosphate-dependent enzyme [Hyphomicrobiales bacterium]|nr:aminotransferase class I/II-fold pyridoxal phosphate-dependent enzyme [Hyphomicrobiales bacterium]
MMTIKPEAYIRSIGKSVVKKVGTRSEKIIDLSLNESSFGASTLALEACQKRCSRLFRYPDPASTDLRNAIGQAFDLDPERIACGNGSEELLDIIGRLYAGRGDEILYSENSFMQFPIVAMRVGAKAVTSHEKNLTTVVDALLEKVSDKTKIVFLANPNNPSGTYVPKNEVKRLRDNLPRSVVLVLDSAYCEYVEASDYSDGLELVEGFENVVVTRTFSKAWGLAALRVGWAYASPSMIGVINRMRGIGNVNAIAQDGAIAALGDPDFVKMVCQRTCEERQWLTSQLIPLGLLPIESATNFLLVEFPAEANHSAGAAIGYLEKFGVAVRDVDDYGLDEYLRITIGLREENQVLIDGLRQFMA